MAFRETKIDRPQSEISTARKVLAGGIAVLALVVTCAVLNRLLPFPEIEVVSRNLRFFLQHRDEFDTIFIGSSRIRHQISPAIFDRTMSAAGLPTRTFNFGINAMVAPEDGYVLERLLGARPRRLRWVFIELDELHSEGFPRTAGTRRLVYWHDGKRTAFVLRAILDAGYEEGRFSLLGKLRDVVIPVSGHSEARDRLFFHTALFFKNFANVGRKVDLTNWIARLWKAEVFAQELESNGYIPLRGNMSASESIIYETELQSAVIHARSQFVSASTEHAYRNLVEDVRKTGATPIFVVTPVTTQTKFGFRREAGIAATIMSFNDAAAYPQLYRKETRIDRNRVNSAAAEEFTDS
jgi:hypothetical protein